MISIIICSINEEMLANVSLNVETTIGVPYEIIAFNNSLDKKGICEVYNDGAKKAGFEILCFMHEDIEFHTSNWGKILIDIFEDSKIGLIGVAGTGYKSISPSGNYCYGIDVEYINLIQSFKHQNREKHHHLKNASGQNIAEVASLDGLWLCTKREIFESNNFDSLTFTGFHGYDIDLSLSIGRSNKVVVSYDILIEHFSEGSFERDWVFEILKLHKKWGSFLPLNKNGLSQNDMMIVEKATYKNFINKAIALGITKAELIKTLSGVNGIMKFSFYLYLKLILFVIKKQ
jgi:glycosyltransferase involved in cell wall biosynthesis